MLFILVLFMKYTLVDYDVWYQVAVTKSSIIFKMAV